MATQKKKTTSVAQKSKGKKALPKKAAPAKKAIAKKAISKKANPAKKTLPVKKAAVKKSLKKVAIKNAAAPKKTVPQKKVIVKKAVPKKAASKLSFSKKISKPIIKNSPAKKTAKSSAKKAAPIKLATSKKAEVKKTFTAEKKMTPIKNKISGSEKQEVNAIIPKTITEHKAELKKALAKVKTKSHEVKKPEVKKPEKPFVMPKTSTEKARKYEPEFTKSVLDQSPEEYNGPTMRYSDNELVEFRELISRKLETAKKELGYLQGLITRKDQMGGDDSDNRYMTMEDGSLSMEREQLSQMASRQITFIDHLEKAMMRIENKTYGICRVTGKLIDKARLRAVPHATLSIEAKMGISR